MKEIQVIAEAVTVKVGQQKRLHSSYGCDCGSGMVKVTQILEPNPDHKEIQDIIEDMVYQHTRVGRGTEAHEVPFEELSKEDQIMVAYWYSTHWVIAENLDAKHREHYGDYTHLPIGEFVEHTTIM